MPVVTLPRLLLSLLSWVFLAATVYLLWRWFDGVVVREADGDLYRVHGPAWMLIAGGLMAAWCFLGRFPVSLLVAKSGSRPDEARRQSSEVTAPDGSRLFVETSGIATAPTVILTHGWGLNATAWGETRAALERQYRVVTWDLPGLGRSKGPSDGKYSLDRFAEALGAVVEWSGADRVLLVGHSIGGMTSQTFFRTAAPGTRAKVAGVALFDTTYVNPMRTMIASRLWLSLRKAVIEPMCWVTVALWPLAWLSAWQSYLNGSSHLLMRLTGFGEGTTRPLVDLTARLSAKGSPAVQAKGNLAMFHWDVTQTLPAIDVPLLVVAGGADIVTLPEASKTISTRAPKAQLVLVPGVGHMGYMEKPRAYIDPLLNLARSTLAGSGAAP